MKDVRVNALAPAPFRVSMLRVVTSFSCLSSPPKQGSRHDANDDVSSRTA
jgi:hypothetical protein